MTATIDRSVPFRVTAGRWVCLILVLAAFGLRVYRLGDVRLSGDEGFTYALASRDYASLLSEIVRLGEPQPAGSFILEKAWLDLGGRSEFNLRMLNVLFGVATVALAWAMARSMTGSPVAAFVAAALVATNPFGIDHSREYRTYAMLACLSLACLAALRACARKPSRLAIVALAACEWAVIQSHYVGAFVVAALNAAVAVWWLAKRRRPEAWPAAPRPGAWLAAQTAVAGLTLPWLLLVRGTATSYTGTGRGQLSFFTVAGEELALFTGADLLPTFAPALIGLGALALPLGLAALARRSPRGRADALTLGAGFALPLLAMWAAIWVRPFFHARYLIAIWPYFALIVAALAAVRGRLARPVSGAIAGALLVASFAGAARYLADLDLTNGWLPIARALSARSADLPAASVLVTIPYPDPSFFYYYPKGNGTVLPGADRSQAGISAQLRGFADRRVRRLLTHSAEGGWWDTANLAASFDPAPYTRIDTYWIEKQRVDVYERVFADRLTPLEAVFTNGLQVRGIEFITDTASTALGIELAFGGTPALNGAEKTFLHLIDPARPDLIVAQSDTPLLLSEIRAPAVLKGMPLPQGLPRARYELWFGQYDASLPGAPRIPVTSGADRIQLGVIELGR